MLGLSSLKIGPEPVVSTNGSGGMTKPLSSVSTSVYCGSHDSLHRTASRLHRTASDIESRPTEPKLR